VSSSFEGRLYVQRKVSGYDGCSSVPEHGLIPMRIQVTVTRSIGNRRVEVGAELSLKRSV